MEITALQFEEMIDRLEKGSGQQVSVSLHRETYCFASILEKHFAGLVIHHKPRKLDCILLSCEENPCFQLYIHCQTLKYGFMQQASTPLLFARNVVL